MQAVALLLAQAPRATLITLLLLARANFTIRRLAILEQRQLLLQHQTWKMKRKQQAMLMAAQPHPFDILLPEKTLQLIAQRSGAVPSSHLPKFDSDSLAGNGHQRDASFHSIGNWKPIARDGEIAGWSLQAQRATYRGGHSALARGCQVPTNRCQKHHTIALQCPPSGVTRNNSLTGRNIQTRPHRLTARKNCVSQSSPAQGYERPRETFGRRWKRLARDSPRIGSLAIW